MKLKLTLIITCLLAVTAINAQITNGDFEAWTTTGSYEDPDDYTTANATLAGFGSTDFTTEKSTDVHGGSFACHLETKTFSGFDIPGLVTNGSADVSFSGVDIYGGVPISTMPARVEGWFKYTPAGADSCEVTVVLTKWSGTKTDTVAIATFRSGDTTATYTMFSADFTYTGADPDTMRILAVSSYGYATLSAVTGSVMLLDDVALAGSVNTHEIDKLSAETLVYPNPAKDLIIVESSIYGNDVTVEVYNILGSKVIVNDLDEEENHLDITNLLEGMYIYQVKSGNAIVSSGKFKVIK